MVDDEPQGEIEYPVELPVTQQGSLRFLLMAGVINLPNQIEDGDWERPLGWEQAAGVFQRYDTALARAGENFPPPDHWWQIVDLKTMTVLFRHDDPIRVLH